MEWVSVTRRHSNTPSHISNVQLFAQVQPSVVTRWIWGKVTNDKWLPHPCLLYITLAFSEVPNAKRGDKIRSGYFTLAFSGAQKRAEMLHHPYSLGGLQCQARGENQKWLPHPCLLGDPEEGGGGTSSLHSRGSAMPSPEKESEVATSDVPSRGPRKVWKCYVTPAFLGVPSTKHGDQIRSGYLTPAFSGAQKRAEGLCHPCILGVSNAKRGDKIRSDYLAPAFLGAKKRAEMLCLGGPQCQYQYRHAFSVKLVIFSLR